MLTFTDSYVYQNGIDVDNVYTKRIIDILKGNKKIIINEYVGYTLQTIARNSSISILTQKAISAVQNKDILLFVLPKELQMPKPLPFIRFNDGAKDRVFIDVSRFAEKLGAAGQSVEYKVDHMKLQTLITAAFVTLEFVDKNALLPADCIKYSAYIWANMYCKVLNGMIQLSVNPDRYYAYMYMAIKFYVIRIMGASETLANSIGESYLARYYQGKKENNTFLTAMEAVIAEKMMKPFDNFDTFCYVMFDDEVGNLKGVKVANLQGHVNTYEYIRRFIRMYQFEALMSLGSFPYFFMTLMSAFTGDYLVNPRSFKDIVRDDPEKNYNQLTAALIKNVKR